MIKYTIEEMMGLSMGTVSTTHQFIDLPIPESHRVVAKTGEQKLEE